MRQEPKKESQANETDASFVSVGVGQLYWHRWWPGTDRAAAASAARTQEAQPVAPTIASAVDKEISGVEKQVVDAAEAMPEEKFNFSPENLNIAGSDYKGVLTFALQVRHNAASNYAIAAHNMALNTDMRAYHTYSFETVAESDSGRLLEEFLNLPVPRLFLFGEENRSLSYLPRLRASNVEVREIAASAHFLFYDNPEMTYEEIGKFVEKHHPAGRDSAAKG